MDLNHFNGYVNEHNGTAKSVAGGGGRGGKEQSRALHDNNKKSCMYHQENSRSGIVIRSDVPFARALEWGWV